MQISLMVLDLAFAHDWQTLLEHTQPKNLFSQTRKRVYILPSDWPALSVSAFRWPLEVAQHDV